MSPAEAAKLHEIVAEARRLVESERTLDYARQWVFVRGRHVARVRVLLGEYDEIRTAGGRGRRANATL